MDTKYFGTDGIRAAANTHPMTPDLVMRVGQAAGQVFKHTAPHGRPTVVIGKDTRLSGYMFEAALQAGFTSVGFYCLMVGPLPTPAVAVLTRSLRADLGVMLTASHNLFADNGLKLFSPNGLKISEQQVEQIETLIDNPSEIKLAKEERIGRVVRLEDAVGRYIEFVKTTLPKEFNLHGVRLVVDCAHGAAYRIAPRIFWELGAQVIRLGCEPDGLNINRNVGATATDTMCKAVEQHGADAGIALDGDGDRLIMCDEKGRVIDGDHLLGTMAQYMQQKGTLQGGGVVGTVMSNMGLETALHEKGLTLVRTKVGDHHVEKAMREHGYNLGGESSGHIILQDYATTGDGILSALHVLAAMRHTSMRASQMRQSFTPWPMKLQNIRLPEGVSASEVLEKKVVQKAIEKSEKIMGKEGRVLVRKSGTEPVIRVMVEAMQQEVMDQQIDTLCSAIQNAF